MSRQLIIRPEAQDELADAFGWYEERLPGLGDEFLLSVDSVLDAILRAPQQYPLVHRTVRRALEPKPVWPLRFCSVGRM